MRPLLAGKFGLGSWNTSNEFKELRIYDEEGKLLYSDDFKTLENWDAPGTGSWKVQNGVLQQTDKGQSPAVLFLKNQDLKTGRVTLKARRVDGAEGFLMFFAAAGPERFLFCNYGAAGNTFSAIQDRGIPEGCALQGGMSTPGAIEDDRWYEIGLTVRRNKAEMYLDGKKIADATMQYLPAFFATAGYDFKDKTVVVKATNYHAKPVRAAIQLKGAANVSATGRHVEIKAEGLYEENSLDNPHRILPEEKLLRNCGPSFSVELAPYSVNVLRIAAERPASR